MNQYQDHNIISNPSLRDRAKGALTGRFNQVVPAFFLVWLITLGANLLVSLFLSFIWSIILITREMLTQGMTADMMMKMMSDPAALAAFLNIYQKWFNLLDHTVGIGVSVVTNVFNVGLSLLCLNLACNRQTAVTDIFYGFRNRFGQSLKLSLVYTLVQELYLFPFSVYLYLYNREDTPSSMLFGVLCLVIAGLILAAWLLLQISQCFFLMLDFPNCSVKELLHQSTRLMDGHKTRLLLLHLSFVPLLILSLFTLGIANLWIVPYRAVAKTFFFLNLMQAKDRRD